LNLKRVEFSTVSYADDYASMQQVIDQLSAVEVDKTCPIFQEYSGHVKKCRIGALKTKTVKKLWKTVEKTHKDDKVLLASDYLLDKNKRASLFGTRFDRFHKQTGHMAHVAIKRCERNSAQFNTVIAPDFDQKKSHASMGLFFNRT